jgi:DNA-binding IclR family transcriptional regulator
MLLEAILADRGGRPVGAIARDLGLPQATAYRLTGAIVARGLLVGCGQGRYLPGAAVTAAEVDPRTVLARTAAPFLRRAARRFGQVAHLGVFEGGMVTYLVKAGSGSAAPFTREGMQLEAYCSGIGKMLLSHLPDVEQEAYLAGGPFIRLTANTIIDPAALRAHLRQVRRQGFALDEQEVADSLKCVAVPLHDQHGAVRAALSISAPPARLGGSRLAVARALLQDAAQGIEQRLYRRPAPVRQHPDREV